ncbi:pyruvate formate-lyase-activating protein [uncultured Salegentibacter sp.]|uniref:pyruvate formate-lyase-activating protein n=1 Tax=uncultured Salegentibacter sp. TaxID=259320 RepID=UPI002592D39F|nr:pyruvate formate-lyase-activating protein [uncultured Salegentibacter sp.]
MKNTSITGSGNLIANLKKAEALRVHSIETFGTHDGPGIRLVIFVQGCQFHCLYCANPDTISIDGGTLMSLDQIVAKAKKQKPFFGKNGGVTISGGEPLLQRAMLKELFNKLHKEGIHTTLDTNGKVIDKQTKDLLETTDLVMLDIKHINNDWHHKITRLSNVNTLKFAEYRESTGKPMWLRYVLVPGYSDQEEYLHQLGDHFKNYKSIEKIEILPYHKLGVHKWEALGWKYELEHVESPEITSLKKVSDILQQYFRRVEVG